MNKICVFAKNKNTYFINRLIEEVGQSVLLFDPWTALDLPVADRYLARTTGVYKSDLDLLILGSLPENQVVNSVSVLKRFRSKSSQWTWFDEQDLPCLPWLGLKGIDPITAEKFSVLYPEMIVKPNFGQGGWGLEVLTRDTLLGWMKKKKKQQDEDYLIQPLIKDATEYRYFFIKDEEAIVLKRKARSGIAANFKREGEAELVTFPAEFESEVRRLISLSGALYGAIDLFIQHDRLFVLELNTVPGIEQLENISRQNIVRKLLQHFS